MPFRGYFLVVLQVIAYLGGSMSMYVMNHEHRNHSSSIKHTKNQRKNEGKVMQVDAVEEQEGKQ